MEGTVRARAEDLCRLCAKRGFAAGDFLTPAEKKQWHNALNALKKNDSFTFSFEGGVKGAERTLPVLLSRDYEGFDPADFAEITPLLLFCTNGSIPDHRAVLGSLLALGVKRSFIGEIFPYQKGVAVTVKDSLAPYLREELKRVGRSTVLFEEDFLPGEDFVLRYEKEELQISVSSLRLDGVISALCRLSREDGGEYVKKGLASVNFEEALRPDKRLLPGDTLSLRGYGRYILSDEEPKETRSGRLRVTVYKYK